ncbi:hypothetical protein [Paenibacillus xylanexedens]|uniref:hypothetical protein n=1 Tax=Paenibacillus xylanexedens TaxID=528191 RepID=UPI00119CF924|nr:hypothetical protein [Paenibacillus xylanexedens]
MLTNFRKTFSPTDEEKERSRRFLESMQAESDAFLMEQGLTKEEINLLEELEGHEVNQIPRFVSYENRQYQLKAGMITVEQVKKDIQAWRDRTCQQEQ